MVQLKIAVLRIESVSIRPSTVGSFWSYVDKPTLRACWPWMGGCNDYGYGVFGLPDFGSIYAHRLAFAFKAGDLRQGIKVRHTCDNPPCCNPWHLIGGSSHDNNQDCLQRKRYGRNTQPKLTEDALTAIAAAVEAGENRRAVADRYGIHVSNLYRAIQRVSEPDPVFEPLIAQADYMDQQRAARRAKK